MDKLLQYTDSYFFRLKNFWESPLNHKLISSVLVFTFVVSVTLSFFVIEGWVQLGHFTSYFKNPFFAVEVAFTLLLIAELFSLIIVLPRSVAKSVGKQFELLSLIFLRNGFKEFSHIGNDYLWKDIEAKVEGMMMYAIGALGIFAIMGFVYKFQKHIKLTDIEKDQAKFVSMKRLLAILLLAGFLAIGLTDVYTLITDGVYHHSFHLFYSLLIFSDIIIVLIALRYTLNYYKIFRYSSFVLATILIRIALSAEAHYNVAIGVASALFVLLLTIAYNYFLRDVPQRKLEKDH
ncbi:MAG TPA: hypothetical protein ENK85_06550 [Saprospiraceae bacterium]|nr:hypothetical protein [Saprospiraceae bacterium]